MINIKTTLLGSALAVALSAPAMAADFHALAGLQGATPVPLQDGVLATTEGGAICTTPSASSSVLGGDPGGGVSLCSQVGAPTSGALFAVSNEAPVTGANFLQVIGGAIGTF